MVYLDQLFLEDERVIWGGFRQNSLFFIHTDYALHYYKVKYPLNDNIELEKIMRTKIRKRDRIHYEVEGIVRYHYRREFYWPFRKKYFIERFNFSTLEKTRMRHSCKDSIPEEEPDFYLEYGRLMYRKKNALLENLYITSGGDSLIIQFGNEPVYCFQLNNMLRLDTINYIFPEKLIHDSPVYIHEVGMRIEPVGGIYFKDEKLIHFNTDYSFQLFDRKGRFKLGKILPLQLKEGYKWINDNFFALLLADNTIRWYRREDGKEMLALFIDKDQKWIMWTPEGYYLLPMKLLVT